MSTKINAPVVITAHTNADFDCLSSMVAAQKLYPDGVLVFPGSQEQSLRDFFIQSATYLFNFYSMKDIDPDSVHTLVVCDTRQPSRLGHLRSLLQREGIVVHAFDHHPDTAEDLTADFEDVRLWGSTVAILVQTIKERGIALSRDEATIMGLGLYEDTGCFTFTSTTEHDLFALWWLKTQGMDIGFIADFLNRELSAEQVGILNTLLEAATRHTINGIEVCITSISMDRYVRDFALLVHKMMEIENIKVLFALARMHDRIQVVARSRVTEVNAGTICSSLGGGGHSYAASATIKEKTLAQVQDEIFGLLYSHINPQITVRSLMSSPAVVIDQNQSISQAAIKMSRFGLKAIPVTTENSRQCVGILEHQLADRAEAHGLGEFPIQEYMGRSISRVAPDQSLYTVMEIIINQGQRLVPVEENERIIGVITRTDLINTLVEEPARIPENLLPERRQERSITSLMRNRLPKSAYALLGQCGELAEKRGCNVYAVGGFVRDILLHRTNLDIDLVVEGDGIAFANQLAQTLGGRIRFHTKFQTAVVILPDGQRIDVATARLEYYEHPAALPTVELSSIKMDLFRRDFSVNALAIELNPKRFGRLVDFFGGQRDLKEKTLRVLHSLSFVEDPTRIMRAIRFEQRFAFRIGVQTERLIKNALHLNMFHKLSGHRILHELKLLLQEENPLVCLKRLNSYAILESIHPQLKLTTQKERLLEKIEKVIDWYELLYLEPKPRIWQLYFLGLVAGCTQDEIRLVARRLSIPSKTEKKIIDLRQEVHKIREGLYAWNRKQSGRLSELYSLLHPLPLEGLLFLMASSRKEEARKSVSLYLSQLKDQELEITGSDLKAMDLPPGPAYTQILQQVFSAKLDGEAQDRNAQLALARNLVQDELARQE
ncbi:CBS domain-containing protein [Desulfovermiculus halophilus]|jgi:tRNA nucleotidyltransferase (CCA-adding enzyme)|uniref:CBS domain-containing protein n=1 Tax=Desulfovermiculus halophilus TaxID=339722 RepID=UPI00047FE8AE|nr:CBS domain-containing protein [Desulfovermiculus halophilus]